MGNTVLKEGSWYRLSLPMEKFYIAVYIIERGTKRRGFFQFPDQSRSPVEDLMPFLENIEEIDRPEEGSRYDIADFLH